MKPVLSIAEMREVDKQALAHVSQDVLVERAGAAVANAAVRMLGGGYGRRIVVVAGAGNNGTDGRVAAAALRRRGARVMVFEALSAPMRIGPPDTAEDIDLVIDAAYGTGFCGSYKAPEVPVGVPVLAVDIPSGVDGDTGEACGEPLRADMTVTFAAFKPGLLQGDGPALAGNVVVADIGLDVSQAAINVIEDRDVVALLPDRAHDSHKWIGAVAVVAGSPGMLGAASLCTRGAYRAGAGMVRLVIPGASVDELPVSEAVTTAAPLDRWVPDALDSALRCRSLVVGPGLGRDPLTQEQVRVLLREVQVPTVVDADGLVALAAGPRSGDGTSASGSLIALRGEDKNGAGTNRSVVLTPHDGEFEALAGVPPGSNRIASARALAAVTGAVVLLKGPTTAVAAPDGRVLLALAGTPRLATAGTGDVLSGVIGAFIARGMPAFEAAGLAAHVHGRAASLGSREGLVAGDLAELVAVYLSEIRGG